MSYTSGPWKVSVLDGRTVGPCRLLIESKSRAEMPQLQAVATVTLRAGETEANARLIAAAPELLAALKQCRGQWIHSINALDCLAAIAKAEGAS